MFSCSRFKIQDGFIASHQTDHDIQHGHISINYNIPVQIQQQITLGAKGAGNPVGIMGSLSV